MADTHRPVLVPKDVTKTQCADRCFLTGHSGILIDGKDQDLSRLDPGDDSDGAIDSEDIAIPKRSGPHESNRNVSASS